MNKLDKSMYQALRFLADNSRAEIKVMKENKQSDYEDNVPKDDVEPTLLEFKYLDLHGNTKFMITQTGLQQLRDLEIIRHRDLTIIMAVLALIISIISFLFSKGWI